MSCGNSTNEDHRCLWILEDDPNKNAHPTEESSRCIPLSSPSIDDDGAPDTNHAYLEIDKFPWYPVFKELCETFEEHGQQMRLVGGAVRDVILQIQPKDIDLCTTSSPDTMVQILEEHGIRHRETGIQHGTVTVYMSRCEFEVTSLRVDTIEGGVKVCRYGRSFKEDANRRDLTINAMSLDAEGRLYDYFNGQQHLKEGKLRFVESAELRVTEDPLRILRYFRFCYSDLFREQCPQEYRDMFCDKRSTLADPSIVAGERIWKEMAKILSTPRCCEALDAMKECKLLRSLGFPVLDSPFGDIIDPSYSAPAGSSDTKAASILGLIFKGKPEMLHDLCNRWKVGKRIRDDATTAANISKSPILGEMKKRLFAELHEMKFEEEKTVYLQTLRCDRNCELSKEELAALEEFERPTFPFTKEHFALVPKFKWKQKDALEILKEAWVESVFTMEVEEMVEIVREMVALEEFERPTFPFTKKHFALVPKISKSKRNDALKILQEAWVDSKCTMDVEDMVEMLREMAEDPNFRPRVDSDNAYDGGTHITY